MNKNKSLVKLLYGYIGFAFFMVFLNILGVFNPLPDILAAIALLTACYYIGKYGETSRHK